MACPKLNPIVSKCALPPSSDPPYLAISIPASMRVSIPVLPLPQSPFVTMIPPIVALRVRQERRALGSCSSRRHPA